jgi:hypothetical protein
VRGLRNGRVGKAARGGSPLLCSLQAIRSRKSECDSCFHYLNAYNFLGYTGFLERFRFAIDPSTYIFYFGKYDVG